MLAMPASGALECHTRSKQPRLVQVPADELGSDRQTGLIAAAGHGDCPSDTYAVPAELARLYNFLNSLDLRHYQQRGAQCAGGDALATPAQLADLLLLAQTDRIGRLKMCASDECRWVFYDRSKPANRRGCSSGPVRQSAEDARLSGKAAGGQ